MFAIVSHKTKQYKFELEKEYRIDLIEDQKKKTVIFDNVMLVDDDKDVKLGEPFIANVTVEGELIGNIKADKVIGTKFHAKKRYKRNLGHRQDHSVVKIKKINL